MISTQTCLILQINGLFLVHIDKCGNIEDVSIGFNLARRNGLTTCLGSVNLFFII